MGKFVDLTGMRVGKLTVIERVESDKSTQPMWRCKCDCGGEKIAYGNLLRSGATWNCGCTNKWKERGVKREPKKPKEAVCTRAFNGSDSICWDCIRSAAPEELQCAWVKSMAKELPEGAQYLVKGKVTQGVFEGEDVKLITHCPMFLSAEKEENQALLKEARKRRNVQMASDMSSLSATMEAILQLPTDKSGLKRGV